MSNFVGKVVQNLVLVVVNFLRMMYNAIDYGFHFVVGGFDIYDQTQSKNLTIPGPRRSCPPGWHRRRVHASPGSGAQGHGHGGHRF